MADYRDFKQPVIGSLLQSVVAAIMGRVMMHSLSIKGVALSARNGLQLRTMSIRVHLDRMMLERGVTLTELAEKVGLTLANLSILKHVPGETQAPDGPDDDGS